MGMMSRLKLSIFSLVQSIVGTRAQELRWRTRKFIEPEDTLHHPRRAHLAERIMASAPDSVLEVGCNTEVTLRLLRELKPSLTLAGLDVNGASIDRGKELSPDMDIRVGSVRELPYADRAFDVVFTDACLLYVGPDAIAQALSECRRVARRAVVVREWHAEGLPRAVPVGDHWLHDWVALGGRIEPAYPQSPEWKQWGVIAHFPPS